MNAKTTIVGEVLSCSGTRVEMREQSTYMQEGKRRAGCDGGAEEPIKSCRLSQHRKDSLASLPSTSF